LLLLHLCLLLLALFIFLRDWNGGIHAARLPELGWAWFPF
jgi:hypothetical protein